MFIIFAIIVCCCFYCTQFFTQNRAVYFGSYKKLSAYEINKNNTTSSYTTAVLSAGLWDPNDINITVRKNQIQLIEMYPHAFNRLQQKLYVYTCIIDTQLRVQNIDVINVMTYLKTYATNFSQNADLYRISFITHLEYVKKIKTAVPKLLLYKKNKQKVKKIVVPIIFQWQPNIKDVVYFDGLNKTVLNNTLSNLESAVLCGQIEDFSTCRFYDIIDCEIVVLIPKNITTHQNIIAARKKLYADIARFEYI